MNFAKFLRTPYLQNTSGQVFLRASRIHRVGYYLVTSFKGLNFQYVKEMLQVNTFQMME